MTDAADDEGFRAVPPDAADLARQLRERVTGLQGVEVLCGIPSLNSAETIGGVVRAVEAGLRRFFPAVSAGIVVADGGSTDGTVEAALAASTLADQDLLLIDSGAPVPDKLALSYPGVSGKGSALRSIFAAAALAGARACAVFDSDLRSIAPGWVEALIAPVLRHRQDLVTPLYVRHRFDGTITNGVAYPLTAALYGLRVRQPIGGEFGFSGELAARWTEQDVWATDVARFGIDVWMTTTAIAEGYRVCQAHLGAKLHRPRDPGAQIDPMFRQVVGTILALADQYMHRWLEADAIQTVPTYGFPAASTAEEIRVNMALLHSRFVEGYARHESLWKDVLSRESVAAIRQAGKDAARSADRFRLPVDLWARIVYDFLVARWDGNRDRALLIDAMLPLFLARTATFFREAADLDDGEAERTVVGFADAFLEQKPYLLSRWERRTGACTA